MSSPNPDQILSQIRAVMEVTSFYSPASSELIEEVERRLAVNFPEWLRRVYLACNGFSGPTGVSYLYPLDGHDGVLEFTQFLREEDWSPPWLSRAVGFGENGAGGSITTHWLVMDGNLIEWCYGHGADYTV